MTKDDIAAVALSVRSLTIDAIETAAAGHPGMPLGCAELGALLYGELMHHSPDDPSWMNRDRFILSAGHGSMFLYSLLYLSGYGITLDDIKSFRRVGSRTPGHPEYGCVPGVETTTGPLGQGIGNAVGFAMAETMLAARFNTPTQKVIDHYTYCIAGDGCMMEGISGEASSLAGHLALGKLIVFYDSNHISIEGSTSLAFTEDVRKRYDAYGWHTAECDGYDAAGLREAVKAAQAETARPSLIVVHTIIGKGAPTKAGTAKVHGEALGPVEAAAAKKGLGIPEGKEFWVDPRASEFFAKRRSELKAERDAWVKLFEGWAKANPELKAEWDRFFAKPEELLAGVTLPTFAVGEKVSTRAASGKALNAIAKSVPNLIGGSADLQPSNSTAMPGMGDYSKEDRKGRVLHFGVREHAMGAIVNGLALHGGIRPFGATFLVFTDYMRGALRLAALMKLPNIYVMTHDSIYLGEDGPTHEPIEHLNSLRMIPDMEVYRPGDAQETALAWMMAMRRSEGPTILALTRQNLEVYPKADPNWQAKAARGAYIVKEADGKPEIVIVATGSEVETALKAQALASGKRVRVVSMLSRNLFLRQDKGFRDEILPPGVRTVVIEAGVASGWEVIARPEDILAINRFGESGKGPEVAAHLGFTAAALAGLVNR